MKEYRFDTTTTMKEYNREKWWIDGDIIRPIVIQAENLKEALKEYKKHAENDGVYISENALRTKSPMYVDLKSGGCKQVGFVITGSSTFRDDNNYCWKNQYVDLWVRIVEERDLNFDEEE